VLWYDFEGKIFRNGAWNMSLYESHYPATPLMRSLFQGFVRMYVRPKISGVEHIPTTGPWILASNHTSHADTAVLFTCVPRKIQNRLHAVAAQDYFFVGGLRQHTARILFNSIPIERDSPGRRNPLRHASRALREGYGVIIYPEGTRSKDGNIGPFRAGIGRLIHQHPGTPIIPALLEGTNDVMPKGNFIPIPRTVRVSFGEPLLLSADAKRASWQAVADTVRAAVLSLQTQNNNTQETSSNQE
jgi:1-acyl-sn-glycerol-3-phosphate acyltransferase